ncbi:myrosinase 1 [Tribolium castaneum]|uniref:Lactase-phlorizin hydrolase-like Protein n=1 Tax=Tribolium castaneum TaxID=7070 RepID=D6X2X9_TRICA|nr:PREDICTED: myrosinase 1 [Tribolium castaneum]XP_015839337.1 PREDICTED: myrosinase 1 [Tribolium castaneum]XP_968318.1 PREDICTED: myrosinase 1 [Tribolium castaneum]EFA10659.1 Lactase-phlorizin hydrolase-like Protein [Tribolium castaneum]|eukprot:XP_015839336.1 PREDICTED: myrosinase 1 [Tribolium castaneum]
MLIQKFLFVFYISSLFWRENVCADNRKFPPDFKFGIATASYQIEGGWDADGKGENIWDHLTHQTNLVKDHSTGDITCDSYHKSKEDLALLKDLGVDFYRFSLSWARILPTGYIDGQINEAGIRYYEDILSELEKHGIEAMVTLYHWDLPQKLQDDFGGVLNDTFIDVFANYAQLAFELFGSRVKYWVTFNEPFIICQQGYENGNKAPAITKAPGIDLYTCAHVVLKAHAKVYHIYDTFYRKTQKGKIGLVLNTDWFEPASGDPKDLEASERQLQFQFGWFAHPIVYGNYPQVMIDRIGERSIREGFKTSRLPKFTNSEIEEIKGTFDFIGLNHYTTTLTRWKEDEAIGKPESLKDISVEVFKNPFWEGSASSWLKVVPWGIRRISKWIKDTYKNPELIITENGYSDVGGIFDDSRRINYYREYLSNVLEAIYDDGVNITAYTAWSFMDNFEWLEGYTEKFGLFSVNFTDPARPRTPKSSVNYFKNVTKTKCVVEQCL